MTPEDINNLKQLLSRMQQEDTHYRVFGAEQHRYRLGPTLPEAELRQFEQQHHIRLPDDYRRFLLEAGNGGTQRTSQIFMGNGGAGPFYGLVTLEQAVLGCDLSSPFPFTASTESLSEEEIERHIAPDNFPGVPGALALCHQGSGIVCWLVVNGSAYGTMWEGRENFYPTGLSFGAWYRLWLDKLTEKVLPRLANEKAIEGQVQIGMCRAEVITICGGIWKQYPFESAKSFLSFAHLATVFEINQYDKVIRIVHPCI